MDTSSSLLGKIASYTEILAKDSHSTVFVSLADAYRQIGLIDDAIEILERGTVNLPNFSPGFVGLGKLYFHNKDFGKAALAFERALAIEEGNLAALKGLAKVRYQQKHLSQARELLARAKQLAPDDNAVQQMLDSLPKQEGKASSPEAKVEETPASEAPKETLPEPDETLPQSKPIPTETLAQLYIQQGLLQEAAQTYRELLNRDPGNDGVRQKLIELKTRMEAPEESSPSDDEGSQTGAVSSGTPPLAPVSGSTSREEATDLAAVLHMWLDAIAKRREHVSRHSAEHSG